jgi:hypothetical protein
MRATIIESLWDLTRPYVSYLPGMREWVTIQYVLSVVTSFLVPWTPTVVILRLRRPRPRLRALLIQPGMVACAVATLAIAIVALWAVPLLARGSIYVRRENLFSTFSPQVSFAVIGAWFAVAVSGRWRPERSWIDRAGRITGIVWIAVTVVSFTCIFLG